MPMNPHTWTSGTPVSARQLNTDLYTYTPYNNHTPNGILFHALPPLSHLFLSGTGLPVAATSGGVNTELYSTTTNYWSTTVNTQALYVPNEVSVPGTNSDGINTQATPSSDGTDYGGGNYLMWGTVSADGQTATTGYFGSNISSITGPMLDFLPGTMVMSSATRATQTYVLDLAWGGSKEQYQTNLEALAKNPSTVSMTTGGNTTPFSLVSTLGALWVGMGNAYETPPLYSGLPAVKPSWTAADVASSANLNAYVTAPLQFLNNRPQLRVTGSQSGTVAAGTNATLQFGTVSYDNYSGWSTSSYSYTVPVSGVYLVHVSAEFNDTAVTGRTPGVTISSPAASTSNTTLHGPAFYSDGGARCRPGGVWLLDLLEGDVVTPQMMANTAACTLSGASSKFIMVWMSALSGSGAPLNFNPYFANGSSSGWTGYNGTFTVTSSPASGCPTPYAGVWTASSTSSGAAEESAGPQVPVGLSTSYQLTAVVWTPQTSVTIGFDWDNNGTYVSTSTTTFTVAANTWTTLTVTFVSPSSGVTSCYPRIGMSAPASGDVVQISSAVVTSKVRYTPPDVGFRWSAGTPGTQLPALFNQHITNDFGFLLNKPYLMSYQTTAQTGLTSGTTESIVMNSATGLVHGSNGDNYGGWNPSTQRYTCVQPGWYLVVASLHQADSTTTPYTCRPGFMVFNSGGTNIAAAILSQTTTLQSATTTYYSGGNGVMPVYLNHGDVIYPTYTMLDGAATYSTTVAAGYQSSFGLVWISE